MKDNDLDKGILFRVFKEIFNNMSKVLHILLFFEFGLYLLDYSVFWIFMITFSLCMLWCIVDLEYLKSENKFKVYGSDVNDKVMKNVVFNFGCLVHKNIISIQLSMVLMISEAHSKDVFVIALRIIYYSMFIFWLITDKKYFNNRENINGKNRNMLKDIFIKVIK